jgi:hypothetical protein
MTQPTVKVSTHLVVGALIAVAIAGGIVAVMLLDTTGAGGSGLSRAYEYDAVSLARFDPNLLMYEEEVPAFPSGFQRSRAIALDKGGRIYVAGDQGLRVFDRRGNLERATEFSAEPWCLTVTDDGAIYLGLKDHVDVLDGQGKRLASWDPLGEEAVLTSIAKYKDHVFVADAGHRVVLHYDLEGNLIDHIGEKDPDREIQGFIIPSPYFDLAVAPDGLLRVSNPGRNRIEAYTFDGDLELWWGQSGIRIDGFCGCCNPVNFAMLRDGSYVTAEKGLIRVKVYESDGTFRGVVAGPDQLVAGGAPRVFENPDDAEASGFDVAVDADGRVYVLDTIENKVRVFTKSKQDIRE